MRPGSLESAKILQMVFWGLAGIFTCIFLLRPIIDPDFWWHLKTGELIWQGKTLLAADPLSFTSPGVATSREYLILNGYWLWQIVYHGGYSLAGFAGVVLLNGLLFAAIVASVSWRLTREKVAPALVCLIVASVVFLLSRYYHLERPQVISFLFASLLMGLFESIQRGGRPSWWLFPLMVVWANCHGGVVVGDILLILFAMTACWDFRADSVMRNKILAWAGAGFLASLINPNGYSFIAELIVPNISMMYDAVSDYKSTYWWFLNKDKAIVFLFLLIAAHSALIFKCRKNLFGIVAFLVISFLSISFMRVVGFYAAAILPVAGLLLPRDFKFGKGATLAILTAAISIVAWRGYQEYTQYRLDLTSRLASRVTIDYQRFPVPLAEFLDKEVAIRGNMFNQYGAGGYLAWKLYPKSKTFIDTRCLNFNLFNDHVAAVSYDPTRGSTGYKNIFEKHDIDYVIQKHQSDTGQLQALLKDILSDTEWVMIYLDYGWYVALKKNGKNDRIVRLYGADKREYLLALHDKYSTAIKHQGSYYKNYLSRADVLIQLGKHREAMDDLQVALRLSPSNPVAAAMTVQASRHRNVEN